MPFTTPKLFSEVCKERAEIARAAGDTEEHRFWAPIAERAERVSKASARERLTNRFREQLRQAEPSPKEVDESDQVALAALQDALRSLRGTKKAEHINVAEFEKCFDQVVEDGPGGDEGWIEKSYPLDVADRVDVRKCEQVTKSIDELAEAVRKEDPALSYDQAVVKVIEAHPALYDRYV